MTDTEYPDDSELVGWLRPGPSTRPCATLRAPITGDVNQQTDNSVGKRINEALPWAVLAALFGGLGFGGLIIMAIMTPQQMRAETRAAQAELRAEFADQHATLRAGIDVAKYEASLAKTIAQRLDEQAKLKR